MKKSKNIGLSLLPLLLCVGIVIGIFVGKYMAHRQLSPVQEKLSAVLKLIEQGYVDEVDIDSLLEASLPDLLASLDPHSAYIPASEFNVVNDEIEGSFSGVGVSFQIVTDSVVVVEVIAGGPAEKVGLLPGDRIVSANGKSLVGPEVTNEDVFKTLRGPKGTKVDVEIKRTNSKKTAHYEITRGDIPVTSVDSYYMLTPDKGYLRVNKFARNTYDEFINALSMLREKGATGFVIDLRDNAGGLLDQAILMANEFLPEGRMIVYTKSRLLENEMQAVSDGTGAFQNADIVVLMNEYSASASEVFAGAVQDNDRGLVIGRRSFGKGLVQHQTMLPDSSAVRLTVARYYTPSGRSIQKDFVRGSRGKYELDIADRYSHGEFYNVDSIKQDRSKLFHTVSGREVFGGGGIMPDIFVPQDTVGYTSYYINVSNAGLVQKFAMQMADRYRPLMKGVKSLAQFRKVIPSDDVLLENFVSYASRNGVPARWYYINQSRKLLLRQIKAFMVRDLLGYKYFLEMYNDGDPTIDRAVETFSNGEMSKLKEG